MDSPSVSLLKHSYINYRNQKYGFTQPIDNRTFTPLLFKGLDFSIVNALRRIIIGELDTWAVDPELVAITTNTSQYNSEVLRERMGLITINSQEVSKIGDVILVLSDSTNVDEPFKNTTNGDLKVYINDLKLIKDGKIVKTDLRQLLPHNSILLTLHSGEAIHMSMKLKKGKGIQNPRWNAGYCMYKFVTDRDLDTEYGEVETNQQQFEYQGANEKSPRAVILTLESYGKMETSTMIVSAINELQTRLNNIWDELGNSASKKVTARQVGEDDSFITFKIFGEDHTIGNVLSYICFNEIYQSIKDTCDQRSDKNPVNYIVECLTDYVKLHPFDDFIELHIKLPSKSSQYSLIINNPDDAPQPVALLYNAMDKCMNMLEKLSGEVKELLK